MEAYTNTHVAVVKPPLHAVDRSLYPYIPGVRPLPVQVRVPVAHDGRWKGGWKRSPAHARVSRFENRHPNELMRIRAASQFSSATTPPLRARGIRASPRTPTHTPRVDSTQQLCGDTRPRWLCVTCGQRNCRVAMRLPHVRHRHAELSAEKGPQGVSVQVASPPPQAPCTVTQPSGRQAGPNRRHEGGACNSQWAHGTSAQWWGRRSFMFLSTGFVALQVRWSAQRGSAPCLDAWKGGKPDLASFLLPVILWGPVSLTFHLGPGSCFCCTTWCSPITTT